MEQTVVRRILAVAAADPDRPALVDPEQSVTFGELVAYAAAVQARLAPILTDAPPDASVAVRAERGLGFVGCALAVMASGRAYVPVDPALPPDRVAMLVEDGRCVTILDGARAADPTPAGAGRLHSTETAADLAYIVFTSGSTGRPKGVEVRQSNLTHLVDWMIPALGLRPGERYLHTAGLSFDAAVMELWPALAAGATVVVAPDRLRWSAERVMRFAAEQRCTVGFVSTPIAEEIVGLGLTAPGLRTLTTGGDRLKLARLPMGFELVNMYGPTEATVATTHATVTRPGLPPIGHVVDGARVLIVRPGTTEETTGEGELLIGGGGVAAGYRGLPELTAQRFVTVPGQAGRWYRTGDVVVRRPDGELDFIGRVDLEQLKVRGVRVEAAEIESALITHPAVAAAAVTTTGDSSRATSLVAFVVPADRPPTSRELREHLRALLPSSVIPGRAIVVDRLPLTPNGKLDRAAVHELAQR